jgi:uncharacterized protein
LSPDTTPKGFEAFLESLSEQSLPPLSRWRPTQVRDMDLIIDADGQWHYQGTPFQRQDLVRLLSSVLVREGVEYFLVSPMEKFRITVEDVPFLATDFEVSGDEAGLRIIFNTNVEFKVPLDGDHPLTMRRAPGEGPLVPYLTVRDNLEARLVRSVFYRLVTLGEERDAKSGREFGITSNGEFFVLGDVTW